MTREHPTLRTAIGRAELGENRFFGHAVGGQLAGNTKAWGATVLAVGHDGLDDAGLSLIDDIVVCSLAADPHIWPLKVTRLASSYGGVVPGLAAGMLSTAGGFMGWGTYAPAARLLLSLGAARNIEKAIRQHQTERRHLPGFGVAFRDQDERAVALRRCAHMRNMVDGKYWTTLDAVERRLRKQGAPANIAAVSAALLLDLGFSPVQIDALGPLILLPNYLANAVEGAAQAPAVLRQLPPETIEDRTPAPRKSPRARGEDR